MWSETVSGKCAEWTEEQVETAAVLCLVYGRFIKVWEIDNLVDYIDLLMNALGVARKRRCYGKQHS
jgi:hypothetical protein